MDTQRHATHLYLQYTEHILLKKSNSVLCIENIVPCPHETVTELKRWDGDDVDVAGLYPGLVGSVDTELEFLLLVVLIIVIGLKYKGDT